MARAYGSSAHLVMKRETVYGQGSDPLAPLLDVINDEGDIVVPVDPRYLGL